VIATVKSDLPPDVIRLRPLTGTAVAELVESTLGTAPDPAFIDACLRTTRGTPFLLRALVDALGEARIAPTAENAGQVETIGAVDEPVVDGTRRVVAWFPPAEDGSGDLAVQAGQECAIQRSAHQVLLRVDGFSDRAWRRQTGVRTVATPVFPATSVPGARTNAVNDRISVFGNAGRASVVGPTRMGYTR